MDRKSAGEETIRQYLLGTLPEPKLSEIEQELFFSEEMSQTASLIEDEIIEQYLDSKLDPHEQKAFKNHFLRPPARRQMLHLARMLRHRLELPVPPAPSPNPYHFLRTYGALMAATVFGASSLYLGTALHEATIQNKTLVAQIKGSTGEQTRPVYLPLIYGVTRGSGTLPKIAVKPTTRTIKVDLVLPSAFAESLDVRLLDHGQPVEQKVWSQTGLKPAPSQLRVVFDMPSQGIRTGTYDLVVSSDGAEIRYPFDVDVIQ